MELACKLVYPHKKSDNRLIGKATSSEEFSED